MPHPYTSTIPGLTRTIEQLRSVFPAQVNADTLRKWSIASNNEGPVLLVLRFLGLVNEDGQKQSEPAKVFLEHDDAAFAGKFEGVVRTAYAKLFETWGDQAWTLDRNKLIAFFRNEDETSARVGLQQALTFQVLATIAGHGPPPAEAKPAARAAKRASDGPAKNGSGKGGRGGQARRDTAESVVQAASRTESAPVIPAAPSQPALTVRIEINLPVSDNQDVYDKIFRSIRANLLNDQ